MKAVALFAGLAAVALVSVAMMSATGGAPSTPGLAVTVDEALEHVESVRGVELATGVPVHVLSDVEFEIRSNGEPAYGQGADLRLAVERALGSEVVDDPELLADDVSSSVLGFYDPGLRGIVVRDVPVTDELARTVVHELVHAVQDQIHGLGDVADPSSDAWLAHRSLVEGEAVLVADLWSDQRSAAGTTGEETTAAVLPLGFLADFYTPYLVGPSYVDFATEGDLSRVHELFEEAPASMVELLWPHLVAGRPVEWPDEPTGVGVVESRDRRGPWHLALVTAARLDLGSGWRAGLAWADDDFVVHTTADGMVCVAWTIAARPGHEAEMHLLVERLARSLPAGTADGSRLDACDSGAEMDLTTPNEALDLLLALSASVRLNHLLGGDRASACSVGGLLASGVGLRELFETVERVSAGDLPDWSGKTSCS